MAGIDTGPIMKSKVRKEDNDKKKGKKKGLAMILARLRGESKSAAQ